MDAWGLTSGVALVDAGYAATCALTSVAGLQCGGYAPYGVALDSDADGCTDALVLGMNPAQGGLRNPKSFWDFFDTPDGANQRDGAVSAADVTGVVARFGTTGDLGIDPLAAPPAYGYHTAFDRSPPPGGADPWDAGAPDGSISAADIAAGVMQFGHSCGWGRLTSLSHTITSGAPPNLERRSSSIESLTPCRAAP